jgi:3-deoxy-D-manno-octulosonic-acid transferase
LRDMLDGRFAWLAASTHPREEAAILEAHRQIRHARGDALLVLAPRHAERGADIAAACEAAELPAARRSLDQNPGAAEAVYIADTMGELGVLYRAVPIAFVGGSLEPHGGQNPLEPARLGAALAFGPSMENFAELARDLIDAKAATRVADADALSRWVLERAADPALAAREGAAARAFAAKGEGTVARMLAALEPILAGLGPKAVTHETA